MAALCQPFLNSVLLQKLPACPRIVNICQYIIHTLGGVHPIIHQEYIIFKLCRGRFTKHLHNGFIGYLSVEIMRRYVPILFLWINYFGWVGPTWNKIRPKFFQWNMSTLFGNSLWTIYISTTTFDPQQNPPKFISHPLPPPPPPKLVRSDLNRKKHIWKDIWLTISNITLTLAIH